MLYANTMTIKAFLFYSILFNCIYIAPKRYNCLRALNRAQGMTFFFNSLLCSHLPERGVQQEPVLQPAGVPSEGNSGQPEDSPQYKEQHGLSTSTGVRQLHLSVAFMVF